MNEQHFFAWAAGFFDGEGWVTLMRSGSGSADLRIGVTQNDVRPLLMFQKAWGGHIRLTNNGRTSNWFTNKHDEQAKFIEAVKPYVVVKADQLAVAQEYLSLSGVKDPVARTALIPKLKEVRSRHGIDSYNVRHASETNQ